MLSECIKAFFKFLGPTTGALSAEDTFQYNGLSWKKDGWGEYDITTLTAYLASIGFP